MAHVSRRAPAIGRITTTGVLSEFGKCPDSHTGRPRGRSPSALVLAVNRHTERACPRYAVVPHGPPLARGWARNGLLVLGPDMANRDTLPELRRFKRSSQDGPRLGPAVRKTPQTFSAPGATKVVEPLAFGHVACAAGEQTPPSVEQFDAPWLGLQGWSASVRVRARKGLCQADLDARVEPRRLRAKHGSPIVRRAETRVADEIPGQAPPGIASRRGARASPAVPRSGACVEPAQPLGRERLVDRGCRGRGTSGDGLGKAHDSQDDCCASHRMPCPRHARRS